MTAADKCVESDNINALKVLVDAGASTNNTLKLARANGRTMIREYLEASVKFQVEDLRRRLEDLEEIQRKKIEAKRNEKKRKLDQEQKDIRTISLKVLKETEEAEKMIEKLNNSINDLRKMEKNTMAMKEKKGMRSTNSEDRQETPPKVGGAGGQEEKHSAQSKPLKEVQLRAGRSS